MDIKHPKERMTVEESIEKAARTLDKLLHSENGQISTKAFKNELEKQDLEDTQSLVGFIKIFWEREKVPEYSQEFQGKWLTYGRGFIRPDLLKEIKRKEKEEAETAAKCEEDTALSGSSKDEIEALSTAPKGIERKSKRTRSEEARMSKYLIEPLEEIYSPLNDWEPEEYVFDVHNLRPKRDHTSNDFKNVDLVCVHWQTDDIYEIVTIEVKLDFTDDLVMQASNYKRFSDRVWIALPVNSEKNAMSLTRQLRNKDLFLFNHVVESGIGIMALRKAKGGSYEPYPVQWPQLQSPSAFEKDQFLEMYREQFELAEVLEPLIRRKKRA